MHALSARLALLAAILSGPLPLAAEGRAGDFDYYVLSLTWSPNWCTLEGDATSSPECDGSRDLGWTLHGLWPEYDSGGWPQDCLSPWPAPSRRLTGEMADIMGSGGLAWYQWRKHGACAGLPAGDYFAQARAAHDMIVKPPLLDALERDVRLPARLIEEAFLDANPQLSPQGITVTCRAGMIQEVRICLTPDLEPRDCAPDAARDCTLGDALFQPIR
ncbi:MAG: ribonuclease T2 [Rubellimicrobium sp.]|nr:ribonuclease T2 [Rubellimicrobium sp.]